MNVKSRSFFPLLLGAIAGFISGLQASGLFQKSGDRKSVV